MIKEKCCKQSTKQKQNTCILHSFVHVQQRTYLYGFIRSNICKNKVTLVARLFIFFAMHLGEV